MVLRLSLQYQRANELLAGRGGQSQRVPRAAVGTDRAAPRAGAKDGPRRVPLPRVRRLHRTNGNFFTSPAKGLNVWPVGAAWLCQHVWEHYRFTADRKYLAGRAYPVLREAAEFLDRPSRTREPDGWSAGPRCRRRTCSSRRTARPRGCAWGRRWTIRSSPNCVTTAWRPPVCCRSTMPSFAD